MRPVSCVLCGKIFRGNSLPQWFIDRSTGEVLGQAHKTCALDAFMKEKNRYMWTDSYARPGRGRVLFAMKCQDLRDGIMQKKGPRNHVTNLKLILLGYMWRAENIDDLLILRRSRELIDLWVTRSKILTRDQADMLEAELREQLK